MQGDEAVIGDGGGVEDVRARRSRGGVDAAEIIVSFSGVQIENLRKGISDPSMS